MIYLNEAEFKPVAIVLSVVYLPMAAAVTILTFLEFSIEILIVSLVLTACYAAMIIGTYRHSKSKKNYMYTEGDRLRIMYPELSTEAEFEVESNDIVNLEYYRITSPKAWLQTVISCIVPQSVFITYVKEGKRIRKSIGTANFDKLKCLCSELDIELVIY